MSTKKLEFPPTSPEAQRAGTKDDAFRISVEGDADYEDTLDYLERFFDRYRKGEIVRKPKRTPPPK